MPQKIHPIYCEKEIFKIVEKKIIFFKKVLKSEIFKVI